MASLFTPAELADTVDAAEWYEMVWQAQQDAEEIRAERAYERSLEDAGYDEARFQEDMEARMGIIEWLNPTYNAPEPCNHEIGYCTGYCEHANVWRSAMQAR